MISAKVDLLKRFSFLSWPAQQWIACPKKLGIVSVTTATVSALYAEHNETTYMALSGISME